MRAALLVAMAACNRAPSEPGALDAGGTRDSLATTTLPVIPDGDLPDAGPRIPDLVLMADEMVGTTVVTEMPIEGDDCAVEEGCVLAAGSRRVLRFDTVTANLGTGDLIIGTPPAAGVSNELFEWSVCHQHHHVRNYVAYELRDAGGTVLVTGRKQAFCLEDVEQVDHASSAVGFSCTYQGISRGWADVYGRYLACQWIDITDVPSGQYTLHIQVNPNGTLPESDLTNNVFETPVSF